MPEQDELVEVAEEVLGDEALEEQDPTRWGFEEGDEIVPGRWALKRLGGGYDYEAYLAWDDDLMSVVVAKCLRPHLVDHSHSLRALKREATHLLGLSHPVVVRGFDAVLEGERPHVVLEFLEGPNLSRLLRRHGPLGLEQLLPLALQICSAVHYLGTRDVVHLDIKPRNIIMGAPPRLIDLSIARTFDEAQKLTTPVGTDAYMAPEQCDPSRIKPGPESDVFGLGATLYHALAGHVPFPRANYDRERDKDKLHVRFPQLHADPEPFPKGVPDPLAVVVMACLATDPSARPTVADVVTAIEPLVASLPTKPLLRKARPGRRR
ncbi:MAG: serine/threonine-protein kinase [Actinomycetota bacterium]